MHVPPVSDPRHRHAALLTAIDAHAATHPDPTLGVATRVHHDAPEGVTLMLRGNTAWTVAHMSDGTVTLKQGGTDSDAARTALTLDAATIAEMIVHMAGMPGVADLLRLLPGPALAGLVTGPESEQDPGYEVRTYAPASGTDDAGPTVVLDAFGWTVMIRQRDTGDADEDPGPSRDTVIEIADGEGPLELIVRGDTRHLT